jgi:hypothetical protein
VLPLADRRQNSQAQDLFRNLVLTSTKYWGSNSRRQKKQAILHAS